MVIHVGLINVSNMLFSNYRIVKKGFKNKKNMGI